MIPTVHRHYSPGAAEPYTAARETGLDVIHAVRDQVHMMIPAILVSGDTSDRVVLADRDVTTFLTKPVDADELLLEIRRQIGNTQISISQDN
jgi:DNA-binding response OmpR family regulator